MLTLQLGNLPGQLRVSRGHSWAVGEGGVASVAELDLLAQHVKCDPLCNGRTRMFVTATVYAAIIDYHQWLWPHSSGVDSTYKVTVTVDITIFGWTDDIAPATQMAVAHSQLAERQQASPLKRRTQPRW